VEDSATVDTSVDQIQTLFDAQRKAFRAEPKRPLQARVSDLKRLLKAVKAAQSEVTAAIEADFGIRSHHETLGAEVFTSTAMIKHTLGHLKEWMDDEEVEIAPTFQPAKGRIVNQPLGVVGIISPWNYPFQLAIQPLVAALSAGCRVMIKPSELTPKLAELLKKMLGELYPEDQVCVVTGGPSVGEAFSGLPFDHLLFTGSTRLGKIIMRAAAENLTPVTLELGGKSPCILHDSFPVAKFAERVVYGKLLNAGQTCVAPDYLLVPDGKVDAVVAAIEKEVARCYPKLIDNRDYTAVIAPRHRKRLLALAADAAEKGAQVRVMNPAGEEEGDGRKMLPRVVTGVTDDMHLMQEEIFGPILPIVPYTELDEAVAYVNDRPRPLALYYFDRNKKRQQQVVTETCSGGACLNETMMHVAQDNLPFGGVGPSGMGAYHGKQGFDTFTHKKSVFQQSRMNGAKMLGPPYSGLHDTLFKVLI